MPVAAKYLDFLREHASTLPHSGRTLIDHLVGTHDLLDKWGNPEPVRLAGLFHSIYGTEIYKHQALPVSERETVALLIGDEAEKLAYIFCVTARPKAFLGFADGLTGPGSVLLHNLQTGGDIIVSRRELNKLLEIETANLIEQGGSAHWLRQLVKTGISPQAKEAIADWQTTHPQK